MSGIWCDCGWKFVDESAEAVDAAWLDHWSNRRCDRKAPARFPAWEGVEGA